MPPTLPNPREAITISDDDAQAHAHFRGELVRAEHAWSSWSSFVAAKYQLEAGDVLQPDGRIVRNGQP